MKPFPTEKLVDSAWQTERGPNEASVSSVLSQQALQVTHLMVYSLVDFLFVVQHHERLGGDGVAIEDETEVAALTLHVGEVYQSGVQPTKTETVGLRREASVGHEEERVSRTATEPESSWPLANILETVSQKKTDRSDTSNPTTQGRVCRVLLWKTNSALEYVSLGHPGITLENKASS